MVIALSFIANFNSFWILIYGDDLHSKDQKWEFISLTNQL